MTFRSYLAIVPRGPTELIALAEHAHEATGLAIAYSSEGLAILASADVSVLPIAGEGAVIGTLFHRYGAAVPIGTLSSDDARSIMTSDGQWLIDRCWGSYVAFMASGSGVQVLRDPSAGLICYRLDLPHMSLFASDAATLRRSGWLEPNIDWRQLAAGLIFFSLPGRETAIASVTELLPGTSVAISDEGDTGRTHWSPWDYIDWWERPAGYSYEGAVRSSIEQAVRAWASVYPSALMSVSGGLDSSIVAACLAPRYPGLSCITLATRDPAGDERGHARILCEAIGGMIREEFHALDDIDMGKSGAPHLARPVSRTQSLAYDAAVARYAREIGAEAFFTGNGGDNVLGFSQSAAALFDRYVDEGPSLSLWGTLRDICQLTGCSPMQAIQTAVRIARRPSRGYRWRRDRSFLSGNVSGHLAEHVPVHPWLAAPADAPPGKAAHIAALLHIQPHLQASERGIGVPVVNPLMSQPVMEACLTVPSWEWCRGGVNRAVARVAFAGVLPPAILARRDKGGPDGFCIEIIDRFRSEIIERLAFGRLAANGIVDRGPVIDALRNDRPDLPVDHVRILTLLEAEAWADHWAA